MKRSITVRVGQNEKVMFPVTVRAVVSDTRGRPGYTASLGDVEASAHTIEEACDDLATSLVP